MKKLLKKILFPILPLRRYAISRYYEYLAKNNRKKLLEIKYRKRFGRDIDWENPKTLNEKILWLELYSDTSMWTKLADKYLVREYVKEKGYEHILVKLYGKWDSAESIDWRKLPNQFVMKVNNGSGDVLVCRDKSKLDIKKKTKKFAKLLSKPFGYQTGELHYVAIPPCIIAEELLDNTKQGIDSDTLIDYKIWCFDGKPETIVTYYNRHRDSVEIAAYDIDWNYYPEYSNYTKHFIKAKQLLPKPQSLQEMLNIASALSKGFPEVRVDLYEIDGKPYFGELTFTSSCGMMVSFTEEYQEYLGGLVRI